VRRESTPEHVNVITVPEKIQSSNFLRRITLTNVKLVLQRWNIFNFYRRYDKVSFYGLRAKVMWLHRQYSVLRASFVIEECTTS
ncbi:hypothetical protein L9F63_006803, partial [Diploptera punctata]